MYMEDPMPAYHALVLVDYGTSSLPSPSADVSKGYAY